MKVKVLKSDDVAWYKDYVGLIFEVSDDIYKKDYDARRYIKSHQCIPQEHRKVTAGIPGVNSEFYSTVESFINMDHVSILRDENLKTLGI